MNKIKLLFFFLLLGSQYVFAQSSNIPLNKDYYHLIDRFEIMSGRFSQNFHSNVKPFQRKDVAGFVDSLYNDEALYRNFSKRDWFNLQYLATDNWEWSESDSSDSKKPFLKYIYVNKADFLKVDKDDFNFHISPVIYFSGGKESESDVTTYINTRGVDMRGNIAKRLGFYSFLSTTQAINPYYVRQWTARNGVVPNEGFWKKFKDNGVDYFTARGYITFELVKKYVDTEFGFDQSFTGSGHRSLILSDFSPGFTYLKFNTRIWKINYTNLFIQGIADQFYSATGSTASKYPKKFIASHHLSITIGKKFNLGLFEQVVIGDSTERFNISYLNPIIFYRALEHQGGSSENVIVGMDATWIVGHSLTFYGQLVLDEFFLKEIKSGEGWWANKFGGQVGLKYINVAGINNFDFQLEFNVARPYLHAHQDTYTNFAHYRHSLGHAFGGSFREVVAIFRYQPLNRLFITAQLNFADYGDDLEDTNWGKDVMKSYNTREQEYGNKIGQGVATSLFYGDLCVSYMLKHNLFFDLRGIYRKLDSENDPMDSNTSYFTGSVRLNIKKKTHDF